MKGGGDKTKSSARRNFRDYLLQIGNKIDCKWGREKKGAAGGMDFMYISSKRGQRKL